LIASPLVGPAGNHEYLAWMTLGSQSNNEINSEYIKNLVNETNHIDTQVVEDAISALVNLGYNRSEVFSIVMKIKKEFTLKHESKDFTVGNIIPLALKALTQVTK